MSHQLHICNMHIYMDVHTLTEDLRSFTIVLLYSCLFSVEKRKGDVGEVSASGCETCTQTDPNGSEGSVQPPTGNEQPEEEDEQDTVVMQLGRSMKDLVLWIVKIVDAAKEEN